MHRFTILLFVAIVLASVSLPLSTVAQAERCFPETGQCIRGVIREYWEKNGGLPVFGYPITSLATETNAEGFSGPTQWFERDRLEDHTAEGKGVLAGRLGAQKLAMEGRSWESLPKVTSVAPGCILFPETGHSLCPPFRGYWERNGGLARFGFPISEPVVERNADGFTGNFQWFERRRMEVHPENQPPYDILLGLLGKEVSGATPAAGPAPMPVPPAPTLVPSVPALNFQGSGQTVTDSFRNPAEVSRVTLQHTGRSNFAVWAYAANGDRELLVNEIGDYSGNVPLVGTQQWYLEIKADGPWSISVQPLNTDQSAIQGVQGRGDYVSGYFTPARQGAVPYNFTHDGQSNFAVWLRCRGGSDLAQNEIGPVNNAAVVDFRSGPCYWEVSADGNWSMRPR